MLRYTEAIFHYQGKLQNISRVDLNETKYDHRDLKQQFV